MAARPGYPLLSAIVGALTGLSQLGVTSVLSLVLAPLMALGVGAFARAGLGTDRWTWVVTVATAGVIVGPTHLTGENLSNALNIALEIGALTPLAFAVGGGRGVLACGALLVASGMAHWDFLALFEAVLAVAFVLALPSSRRDSAAGVPPLRTEAGLIGVSAVVAGAIVATLVGAVLRAPFKTIEIGNDRVLFRRKLRTDVARLVVPETAALLAPAVLPALTTPGARLASARQRRFALHAVSAWTYVMAAGIVLGALTLVVPPARFLAHLVVLPGALAVGALLARGGSWLAGRTRVRATAGVLVVVALAALAVPAVLRWYRYPVLMDPRALQQAETAGRYVDGLPPHQAVVFLVGYEGGKPGVYGPVMSERTIRIGMPAARAVDVHLFVGAPADLLAGRRTPPPDARAAQATGQYWEDVRALLPAHPPVLVLEATAPMEFAQAVGEGAPVIGPGVALLRGPAPPSPLPSAPLPREVPSLWAGLVLGLAVLLLLAVAGMGWTALALPARSDPAVFVSLTPVVGTGALILGGLAASLLGVRPSGPGAVATYAVVVAAGAVLGLVDRARRRRREHRGGPGGSSQT